MSVKRIVYTMDDPAYNGGAHVATLAQIQFVHQTLGYQVAVLSIADISTVLQEQYPFVEFIGPNTLYGTNAHPQNDNEIIAALMAQIQSEDIVCVPFENSRFRQPVSAVHCCHKIQWVHIDYAHWRGLNSWTHAITQDDGDIYRHFNKIVFISHMSREGFVSLYPQLRNKCWVCRNFMDTTHILQLAAAPSPAGYNTLKDRMRLVTVARMEDQQKAIGRSLMIAHQLHAEGLDFEWVFVGGGQAQDMLMYHQYIADNGLSDTVILAGPQENPFVFVTNADLFCLFSHYEGIPNTIFESLIISTPVAATRVGATAEQVTPAYGWLFENRTESIVQGLSHLLKHPQLIRAAKNNLSGYHYNNDAIQKTITQILDTAIAEEPKDMIPSVSVIVPVYNVQDYLDQCLASLAAQTLENIEILVVNDGSTDSSGDVIDNYVNKYPDRFFRFDKENGGLGDARNYGINQARGEYVAFVDSDDFVESDMMQKLYQAAVSYACDIVQCDLHGFNNNVDYQAIERTPFIHEGIIEPKTLMLNAAKPVVVSACTKLYRKSLFENHRFPNTWYEDLGLIPILFSFASVYYLPLPLYHYRWERAGSIQTQKHTSTRTLEILQSQQRIMEQCNPVWRKEAEYAVYEHSCRFFKGTPRFATQTLEFIHKNAGIFLHNHYIQEDIATGNLINLLPDSAALPKTIHYLCLDEGEPTATMQACLNNWQQVMPDWHIHPWYPTDFDMAETPYLQRAWMQKDYAAAAGYLACKILQRDGGLYLDPGMWLHTPLTDICGYQAFFPWAGQQMVSWEIMGASRNHPVLQDILALYQKADYHPDDFTSLRHSIWALLAEKYSLKTENTTTCLLDEGIILYPTDTLLIDTGITQPMAEHRYNNFSNRPYHDELRHELQKYYYLEHYAPTQDAATPQQEHPTGTPAQLLDATIRQFGVVASILAIGRRIVSVLFPAVFKDNKHQNATSHIKNEK